MWLLSPAVFACVQQHVRGRRQSAGGGDRSSGVKGKAENSKGSVEIPCSKPALENNLPLGGELQDKTVLGSAGFLNPVLELQHMLIYRAFLNVCRFPLEPPVKM